MTENLKAVGARIRIIRKAKQVTQEALAEQVEIEPKSLGRIEKGANLPSLQTLNRVADALGVSIADFFAPSNQTLDVPATLAEMRCRLHEYIPTADETTIVRWYKETFKE
jgi:transcriptional regulator with XRE-family HTH domain